MAKRNKYDYLIILLIGSLCFGGVGGVFQPIRVIALIFVPFVYVEIFFLNKKSDNFVVLFFGFWFFYSLVSLLWTPSLDDGGKQVLYFFIHFTLFFLLICSANRAINPMWSLIYGWLFAGVLTLPIAFYEVITDNHLPIARFGSEMVFNSVDGVVAYRYADATYGDLNLYSAFLCYVSYFILLGFLVSNGVKQRFLYFSGFLLVFFLVFFNSSRGAILTELVLLTIFAYCYIGQGGSIFSFKSAFRIIGFGAIILMAIFFVYSYSDVSSYRIFYRFASDSTFEDQSRFDIYQAGWEAAVDSLFLGAGVGSEVEILSKYNIAVPNSHNLILEILIQYGFFIAGAFVLFCSRLVFDLYNSRCYSLKFVGLSFLFSFVPIFVVVSGYLLHPSLWAFLGSLYVLGQINFRQ